MASNQMKTLNIARKQIFELMQTTASNADECIDFPLSKTLDEYITISSKLSPNFVESSLIIQSAAQIYGRRVDYLERLVLNMNLDEAIDGLIANKPNVPQKRVRKVKPFRETRSDNIIRHEPKQFKCLSIDKQFDSYKNRMEPGELENDRFLKHIQLDAAGKPIYRRLNLLQRRMAHTNRIEQRPVFDKDFGDEDFKANYQSFYDCRPIYERRSIEIDDQVDSDPVIDYPSVDDQIVDGNGKDSEQSVILESENVQDGLINTETPDMVSGYESLVSTEQTINETDITIDESELSVIEKFSQAADAGKMNQIDDGLVMELIDDRNEKVLPISVTIDEGIDLSDIEHSDMASSLTPTVQLIDILGTPDERPDGNFTEQSFDVIQPPKKNVFGIPMEYLQIEEVFRLPAEIFQRTITLPLNILGLPLKRLQKTQLFTLGIDFTDLMNAKRKRDTKGPVVPCCSTVRPILLPTPEQIAEIKLVLGQTSVTPTPVPEENLTITTPNDSFLNQSETDVSLNDLSHPQIPLDSEPIENELSTTLRPTRTLSRDSGLADPIDGADQSDLIPEIDSGIDIFYDTLPNTSTDEPLDIPSLPELTVDRQVDDELLNDRLDERETENGELTRRVSEWHKSIQPMLAHSHKRSHFDMYAYGTEMMEAMQRNETEGFITFKQLMGDKDLTYTSRYFLSMLQLANTKNLEITVIDQSPNHRTPPENIHIKLLKPERFNSHLQGGKRSFDEAFRGEQLEPSTSAGIKNRKRF